MLMDHSTYEIQFDKTLNAAEQLKKIKLALEECAAKYSTLSKEMQRGLEREARKLKSSADQTGKRADEMRLAFGSLETITEGYREAEELSYNKLTEIDHASDHGGSMGISGGGVVSGAAVVAGAGTVGAVGSEVVGGGESDGNYSDSDVQLVDGGIAAGGDGSSEIGELSRESGIENLSGSEELGYGNQDLSLPPGFELWNNDQVDRTNWWENLTEGLQWDYIDPVILITVGLGGNALISLWNLIMGLTGPGEGAAIQGGENEGAENAFDLGGGFGSEDGGDYGTGAHVGIAHIDRPEDEFQDSMSGVDALTGRATSADEMGIIEEPVDSIEYGESEVGVEAVEVVGEPAEAEAGVVAGVSTSSGGSSGSGAGSSTGLGAETEVETETGVAATLEADADVGADDLVEAGEEASADVGAGVEAVIAAPGRTDDSTRGAGPGAAGGTVESLDKSSSGLAPPLIGAGSALSMAAAGISAKGAMGKGKNAMPPMEKIPPKVEAKESNGHFAGELSGDYVMVASGCSMIFAGLSIGAAVGKSRKKKPDDRFRTGYGVSAVVSGGPVQERNL